VATELYKNRRLKSIASHDLASDTWLPSITIRWNEGDSFHLHTFDGPPKCFVTAEDAIAYGFLLARLWVDQKL
jgi:hypothetical protein